jgi:3D (Asp-Asp-Asp) domain-containing protein
MEDSVKVESKRSSGRHAALAAISRIAAVAMFVTGVGLVPTGPASAQVAEIGLGSADSADVVLPPADVEPKADGLRQPSGLGAVETAAPGVRKPTVVQAPKPKPAPPKPAKAPAAAAPAATAAAPAGGEWKSAKASWYGPGFYGNTMAGGGTLTPSSMVVAHRTLPFGTKIEFSYKGRTCIAVVQDRGPHIAGRVFDLGPGTAKALGFSGVGTVQYRIL